MTQAPHPDSTVAPTLLPPPPPAPLDPSPMVQAAHAWRSTVRPPAPRADPWPLGAAMTVIAALLGVYVWTIHAAPPVAAPHVAAVSPRSAP